MHDRATIAREAAAGLRLFADQRNQYPLLIGFDGFVDSIISVVDKRHSVDRFDPVDTIEQWGRKILAAARQSSNYELVVNLEKLGGNGPIMANAMASFGLPVTYLGALGFPGIHPVFTELSSRARCLTIANPGLTDALEFHDGKVMLGKHHTLREVNWERICEVVGAEAFGEIVRQSRFIGMMNWTMLPRLTEIWQRLVEEILPAQAQRGAERWKIFIDLADPEKRTIEDLEGALQLCARFQHSADTMLGLNLKEAVQVARVLKINPTDDPEAAIEPIACAIRERLTLTSVVVHPRFGAAGCLWDGKVLHSGRFIGPFVAEPRLSTGAGDLFNSGFCLGRLAGLTFQQSLAAGTASSGYYVRHAASPTLELLIDFLENLPEPEA